MENEDMERGLSRARDLWLGSDFSGAFAVYDELIRRFPNAPEVLREYAKARYWEFSGQSHEDATRLLEQAISADPTSVDGLLWLAHLYGIGYGQGYEKAAVLCRKAIELAPNLPDSYISLGLLQGRPGVALTREEAGRVTSA